MNNHDRPINGIPLLEVQDICLGFPGQKRLAVDHVSFSINPGSTLGLVGSSGAGKSSIARMIMQLAKPRSGDILFKGESIFGMDAKQLNTSRQNIQVIFQEPSASLSPKRKVGKTLLEPLEHFGIGDSDYRQARVHETLRTVGLGTEVLGRYPHQFSSGQQQRIAIARALVTNPQLLIADEAVSSLDVSIQAQILKLLQTLQEDLGITLLFISHDLGVIQQVADDIAVMYRGQLVEQSSAGDFFAKPTHPYSQALLSFAEGRVPDSFVKGKWLMQIGREISNSPSGCVFLNNCPDKMDICEYIEPETYPIKNKKRLHCVKCHLYNEVKTNDDIKTTE